MADIFISYPKADHALALTLSAFLESEGWTVWWDKSLGAADLYRDEIMKQLVAARAVITIWSPNSIQSDWVRAEAGRAKADGKLIPVKTPELTYADIPLPFGEMHTENVGSTDLLRAAVVAQLAKPAVSQSPFWQITSTFKYQVLTWIGIVGSAVTLFANLSGVLDLADWAGELVAHWHEWSQVFWQWVFSLIKLKVPTVIVPIISFIAFTITLVVGVNLSVRIKQRSAKSRTANQLVKKVSILVGGVLLYLGTLAGIGLLFTLTDFVPMNWWRDGTAILLAVSVPTAYLLFFGKERLLILTASLLFLAMGGFLLVAPTFEVR